MRIFIFIPEPGKEQWLILCNFHEKEREIASTQIGSVLLSNYTDTPQLKELHLLRPYEAVIYRLPEKVEMHNVCAVYSDKSVSITEEIEEGESRE